MATKKKASRKGSLKKTTKLNKHGRRQISCLECGLCCTYVAVEVEGPTGLKAATEILWYLYHERVSVFRDIDDEWLLQFEAPCQHVQEDNKCSIYGERPHICRAFDEKDCEVNVAEEGLLFSKPGEYLEFLRERKPALYRKLEGRFIPPEETWDGAPVRSRRLKPYDERYKRLRVLGASI